MNSKREPVVVANTVAGAISALIVAAVALGVLPWSAEQQAAVMAAVIGFINVIAAVWARGQVTPLADPRDASGEELYSSDMVVALARQMTLESEHGPANGPQRGHARDGV